MGHIRHMKIAVNCWVLRNKQLDGIGNFTVETLPRIIRAHPEVEFMILCDKHFTESYFDFPNVTKHHIFPPYRHPLLYVAFMEWTVRRFLAKHKPDIFLSMEGFLSLGSPCRQLPIIYDLNFEEYPQDLTFKNRVYFRSFFPRFARKAARIATISEYSKEDIVKRYKISAGQIDNVSCGIKEVFGPLREEEKVLTRQEYTSGNEYFFFVGSMHPRKNIVRLLQAFDLYKKEHPSKVRLVLSGHILWDDTSINQVLDQLSCRQDIVFTGRVTDDQLRRLIGSALCLSFVPTFEGFGLPIVEAFQAGVPVICSNTTSMPEVAGNAAIQVDPFNINDIAGAMGRVSADQRLRDDMIQKGFVQKNIFTWDRTASLLYDCILRALPAGS